MIVRWVCEKDKKKWIYPVERCIYCKGLIKKQISTKAKIVGITKVNISSPLHPIVPYNVILLEDEFGNRMPKKTMKDYRIGDQYSLEKAKTDSAVAMTKIKYDLGDALRHTLGLLRFKFEDFDNVLIKPSIIEPAYPYQAVDTNPQILDELIMLLKEKGISDILVAEQSMPGNDTVAAAKKSGILDVCLKHKIGVADLGKSEYVEKEHEGMRLEIAKEVFERKVINLPIMKTNSQVGISGAMENMIRVTSPKTQKELFDKDIEKTLPLFVKALPGFLTIGDAVSGMQGDGPTSMGEPAFLNILYASRDPVALDAVFAETCMFPLPKCLEEAKNLGVGKADIGEIEIVGDELDTAKFRLKSADREATPHSRIRLLDGKADPASFNGALKMCSSLIGIGGYELYLAIGRHFTQEQLHGKSRIVAYGSDAISVLKNRGIGVIVEIPENAYDAEKIMMLKSVIENKDKTSLK